MFVFNVWSDDVIVAECHLIKCQSVICEGNSWESISNSAAVILF